MLGIYGSLLRNFGVMPSSVDEQDAADFFTALSVMKKSETVKIDKLLGW